MDTLKNAVRAAESFLAPEKEPEKCVLNIINAKRIQEVKENRERLKPIVDSIIYLGQNNIAFRGHRDDGKLDLEKSRGHEGNFRELLKLLVKRGDIQLKKHLENCSSRATYISKTTQNEIIETCGEVILEELLKDVQKSIYFSIIFDETTDLSHVSQLSLIIRYVTSDIEVKEIFVKFLDVFDELSNQNVAEKESSSAELKKPECDEKASTSDNLKLSQNDKKKSSSKNLKISNSDEKTNSSEELRMSGENLGNLVLSILKEFNLNIDNCVGISTDGCSVMTSKIRGAVVTIQKKAKNAVFVPCHNHALNLSISQSSNIRCIWNSVFLMKETIAFFTASAKRNDVLKANVGHQLEGLCETRWIERHEGVSQFRSELPKIIQALDEIALWEDSATAFQAKSLITNLCESGFLVSLYCLHDVLSCTETLSRYFQTINIDLYDAHDLLKFAKKNVS